VSSHRGDPLDSYLTAGMVGHLADLIGNYSLHRRGPKAQAYTAVTGL
jgi:hypothetical protein